jgi:Holliday junction resolvase
MSLNRYAKKRDTSERPIIEALKSMGMDVVQIDRPVDLLIGWRGQCFIAECKTDKAKLNDEQARFVETWRGQVAVLRNPTDAVNWANEVTKR